MEYLLVVVAVGVVAGIVFFLVRDRLNPARREKEGLRHLKEMVEGARDEDAQN